MRSNLHFAALVEREIFWCELQFEFVSPAFLASYVSVLRHTVISFHSQKPMFSLYRQRSCGEAVRAQRVLVPPPPGSAASLSGQGLNTGCYC